MHPLTRSAPAGRACARGRPCARGHQNAADPTRRPGASRLAARPRWTRARG